MTDQRALRRKIAQLEGQQHQRVLLAEKARREVDDLIAEKDREIENLRAQVNIRGVA